MSISAAINDLGALASARSQSSPRAQAVRSGDERDDVFGQMLRENAKEPPAAPGRDADWLADRSRSEQARAQERPQRDKEDLPDAATESRSDKARRGSGAHEADHKASCDRQDGARAARPRSGEAKESTEDRAAPKPDATTAAEEAKAGEAAAAASGDANMTTDQAAAAAALAASNPTADATPAATDAAAPVIEAPQVTVAPVVAAPALAQVKAAATGEEAPAITAATPAAANAAAELLAESAPAAVSGADALTATTGEGQDEAGPAAARTAAAGAQAALPEKALEALAALKEKQAGAEQPEQGKALGHSKEGKALGHAKQAAEAATSAGAPQTGEAPQPTGQPSAPTAHAAATLEAVRASLTDGQPQNSQPQATGVVSISASAPSVETRAAGLTQAAQRAEIPVPMQAVAIEIGMRAMRGSREFAIRLDPEDLGRIDVKLEVSEAGEVQARVVVEKVETLQLLQRDARTLERAFDQAGLKTSPDGLQFSLRDQGGQGRNGGDQPPRGNAGRPMADEAMIDEIRLQPAQYRTAAASGLDIRI